MVKVDDRDSGREGLRCPSDAPTSGRTVTDGLVCGLVVSTFSSPSHQGQVRRD